MFEMGASGPQLGHAPSPLLVPSLPHGRFTTMYEYDVQRSEAKNSFIYFISLIFVKTTSSSSELGFSRFPRHRSEVMNISVVHTKRQRQHDEDSRTAAGAQSLFFWPKLLRDPIDRMPLYSRAALCFTHPTLLYSATRDFLPCLALPSLASAPRPPPGPPTKAVSHELQFHSFLHSCKALRITIKVLCIGEYHRSSLIKEVLSICSGSIGHWYSLH